MKTEKTGFTLAEVLITLGIIGVVAAMTIPTLTQNVNEKQLLTATNNFNRKFGEALKIMNTQGTLEGRRTTQRFLEDLGKVYKIAKICDNTKLDQCFAKEITWGEGDTINVTEIKTAKDIALKEYDGDSWNTEVMGVRFANGVSGLIAYNPKCRQDQYNHNLIQISRNENKISFSTNNCIAMIYDVSSNKKPNKMDLDISRTSNVKNLGGIIANINGVKLTKITNVGEYGFIDCTNTSSEDFSNYCEDSTDNTKDYWAAAAKSCGGKDNLPTEAELLKISKYLYDDSSKTAARLKELEGYGFPAPEFKIWTSNHYYKNGAMYRTFKNTSSTGYGCTLNCPGLMTICVNH